jgi:hypothetical protein
MAEKTGATFGELFKAKAITDADVEAAVDAHLADPTRKAFVMGESHEVDLHAAVEASKFATLMLADPAIATKSKRSAVRTAILLARPVKA